MPEPVEYIRDTSGEQWWCNTHHRLAEFMFLGKHVCDPSLGGILLPCDAIEERKVGATMPEPEPMGWREAEEWLSLGYRAPGPVVCRADLFRAIALARLEKARADAIGVTVKVQGPDALGKFAASCEEVPGALGYGDTSHEAEISSRRAVVPVLMTMLGQQKERADLIEEGSAEWQQRAETAEEMLADLPNWEINYAALKDLADKLAEAVGRLPLTGGPVVDALRAYREWPK